MKKIITLSITSLLAFASIISYVIINDKITAGEQQYAAGQQQLVAGKRKLAAGQKKLSNAKGVYGILGHIPVVQVAKETPGANLPFQMTEKKLAQGDQQVASGKKRIRSGEQQLAAGAMQLATAKKIRTLLGFLSIFFIVITIALGVFWKNILKHE